MVSLNHTNLTGFFTEVDEQKKNKVVRPDLPGRATIIKL